MALTPLRVGMHANVQHSPASSWTSTAYALTMKRAQACHARLASSSTTAVSMCSMHAWRLRRLQRIMPLVVLAGQPFWHPTRPGASRHGTGTVVSITSQCTRAICARRRYHTMHGCAAGAARLCMQLAALCHTLPACSQPRARAEAGAEEAVAAEVRQYSGQWREDLDALQPACLPACMHAARAPLNHTPLGPACACERHQQPYAPPLWTACSCIHRERARGVKPVLSSLRLLFMRLRQPHQRQSLATASHHHPVAVVPLPASCCRYGLSEEQLAEVDATLDAWTARMDKVRAMACRACTSWRAPPVANMARRAVQWHGTAWRPPTRFGARVQLGLRLACLRRVPISAPFQIRSADALTRGVSFALCSCVRRWAGHAA